MRLLQSKKIAGTLGILSLCFCLDCSRPSFHKPVTVTFLTVGLCAAPLAQVRWPNDHTSALGNVAIVIFQTVPFALATTSSQIASWR